METKQIQEDISYIKNMIENNRRSLVDNGLMLVNNGIYVVVGVVLSYVLGATGKGDLMPYLWLILMVILIAVNAYVGKKSESKQKKKTFASEMFSATWISCGIPMGIASIIFLTTDLIPFSIFFFFISTILGIAYYLSGTINDLPFMKYLALGWWVGAFVSLFWQYLGDEPNLALFFAFLLFVLEVIPGIIIFKKMEKSL